MKKKGALSLSVSTMVVVIIAILMLSLGVIFVKKVMCGAIQGVTIINEQTIELIKTIYQDHSQKVAIKESSNEIRRGISYGVGFIIRNIDQDDNRFSYSVSVLDIEEGCKISEREAEKFIILGQEGTTDITLGDSYAEIIRFDVPKNTPLCEIRYKINVRNSGEVYDTSNFDIKIKEASFLQNLAC